MSAGAWKDTPAFAFVTAKHATADPCAYFARVDGAGRALYAPASSTSVLAGCACAFSVDQTLINRIESGLFETNVVFEARKILQFAEASPDFSQIASAFCRL
jgi:hypothetical protein